MFVTTLHLNPRHQAVVQEMRDVCALHSRVIDATVGMDDTGPRVLFAVPRRNVLTIRAPEPVGVARLPRGYATAIQVRPWQVPDVAGRWLMAAVLNPGRNTSMGRPTQANPGRRRVTGRPLLIVDEAEQGLWLGRRLEAGATVADFTVAGVRIVSGAHRTGRTVTSRQVSIRAVVDVADPAAITDRLVAGIGLDKTWGCGLSVWERT